MNLPNRAGCDGMSIKRGKDIPWLSVQIFDEYFLHLRIFERLNLIEQTEQCAAVVEGKEIGLQGEHLAELDESAANLFNHAAKSQGAGKLWSADFESQIRPARQA